MLPNPSCIILFILYSFIRKHSTTNVAAFPPKPKDWLLKKNKKKKKKDNKNKSHALLLSHNLPAGRQEMMKKTMA